MATLPALMTVEQFQELPLDRGPVVHELHHGEVVTLTRPKAKHYRLQTRLLDLLRPRTEHLGVVGIEMPFRAVPQFDLPAASDCRHSRYRPEAPGDHWQRLPPRDRALGRCGSLFRRLRGAGTIGSG